MPSLASVPWSSTHLDRRPASIEDVLTDSLGCYSSPPTSHLELLARVPGYRPADLDALFDEKKVLGLRCLRGSAFLIPVSLLPTVLAATRDKNIRAFASYVGKLLADGDGYETWAGRIEDLLGDGIGRSIVEIKEALQPPEQTAKAINFVVSQMAAESRLARTGRPASWRSGRNFYTLWDKWLPGVDPTGIEPDQARVALASHYAASHGPVTAEDFSWWSGLTITQARTALDGVEQPDLHSGEEPPRGVRLLPVWDVLFVTWKDRSRLLADALLPYVYDADGNATSVLLVDGAVAGVWNLGAEADPLQIRVATFDPPSRALKKAVADEADLLGGVADAPVEVVWCRGPASLRELPRNRFLRPLADAAPLPG